jgi:pimeloyl-ACP methyl ester carboxylesterase
VRRAYKIAIGVLVGLAVLLVLNTIVTDHETKGASVTVAGAQIERLPGGDLQVLDTGPRSGSPIVLLHCYTCSINWWQRMIPLLTRAGHRVIAIDLLGHGGSEKPSSGYGMEDQAQLVAQALGQLGVTQATVVGHSLGATVATALAQSSPDLVNRLVIIDQAPDNSYGSGLGFFASLGYVPVIGEAAWRTKPHFLVKDGLGVAFAPGYDVPDQFVDDVYRMTYTSYERSAEDEKSYTDDEPLNQRLQPLGKPLLVIFGSEDQIYDPRESLSAYADIPNTKTALIQGAGHSPNVEKPGRTAGLVLQFARGAPTPASLRRAQARRRHAIARAHTEAKKRSSASARPTSPKQPCGQASKKSRGSGAHPCGGRASAAQGQGASHTASKQQQAQQQK